MKTILVLVLGTFVVSGSVMEATAFAADDLDFATPAVTAATPVVADATPILADTTPACAAGNCPVATETAIVQRRPVANWLQDRRPVRRVLRGAVRLVGRRCCS